MPIQPGINHKDECDPQYSIVYENSAGQSVDSPSGITYMSWGRQLDNSSRARIVYGLSDPSCCQQLGNLEPFVNSVAIRRNGRLAWYGWILRIEYGRDIVEIDAIDATIWLRRRGIHTDIKSVKEDVATTFQRVWDSATAPDPINNITVTTTPTGTLETRDALVADNRYAWSIVKEMLDSALDVTVFGKNILAGNISNSRPIEMNMRDLQGEPKIVKDGTLYGNRVIFDANEDVVGIYPPGPAAANSSYPLVETIIKDAQIQDKQSAQNAAQSRYEFSRKVPRLVNISDAMSLSPYTSILLEDLIPGSIINLQTEGLCYEARESFRLGTLDVNVSGGNEQISISLQPTGPFSNLESADDAVI